MGGKRGCIEFCFHLSYRREHAIGGTQKAAVFIGLEFRIARKEGAGNVSVICGHVGGMAPRFMEVLTDPLDMRLTRPQMKAQASLPCLTSGFHPD